MYVYPFGQKVDSSQGVLVNILAFSERKRIFLITKKDDLKHCENWRVSLVQNSTHIPKCAIEVIGENSCEISSLIVPNDPPVALVPFRAFFGLMDVHIYVSVIRKPGGAWLEWMYIFMYQ